MLVHGAAVLFISTLVCTYVCVCTYVRVDALCVHMCIHVCIVCLHAWCVCMCHEFDFWLCSNNVNCQATVTSSAMASSATSTTIAPRLVLFMLRIYLVIVGYNSAATSSVGV